MTTSKVKSFFLTFIFTFICVLRTFSFTQTPVISFSGYNGYGSSYNRIYGLYDIPRVRRAPSINTVLSRIPESSVSINTPKMSSEVQNALLEYVKYSEPINGAYRSDKKTRSGEIISKFLKSSKTTKRTTLYRGYTEDSTKLLSDKGFLSTSKDINVAKRFASDGGFGKKQIIEVIDVPKGTNAVDLDGWSKRYRYGNEKEVLLDKGLKRQFIKEKKVGHYIIRHTKIVKNGKNVKARAMRFFTGVLKYAPIIIEVAQDAYEFYKVGQKYYNGQLIKQDMIITGSGLAGAIAGGIAGAKVGSMVGKAIGSYFGGDVGASVGEFIGGFVGGGVGAFFGNLLGKKIAKSVTAKYFPTLKSDFYFNQLCNDVDEYYKKKKSTVA